MAWVDVSSGINTWAEVIVSQGYTLFGGMPMGLLLALTYPVDETIGWTSIVPGANTFNAVTTGSSVWGSTTTGTTTWTPV